MTDFSFHSLVVNGTQIRFLFLWNEANTINVSISLSFQFLLVYGREEFLMGSFVIGNFIIYFRYGIIYFEQCLWYESIKFLKISPIQRLFTNN